RMLVHEDERAGLAGRAGRGPDELVVLWRQTGPQRSVARLVDGQAIPLAADIRRRITLEHLDGDPLPGERVSQAKSAQPASNNDRPWCCHSRAARASQSLNADRAPETALSGTSTRRRLTDFIHRAAGRQRAVMTTTP